MQIVCEQSHKLASIPGLDTALELFWVPGHAGVYGNDIVDNVCLARSSTTPRENHPTGVKDRSWPDGGHSGRKGQPQKRCALEAR